MGGGQKNGQTEGYFSPTGFVGTEKPVLPSHRMVVVIGKWDPTLSTVICDTLATLLEYQVTYYY